MDADTDYAALVEEIRTQSSEAPGSDTERVTFRTFETVDETVLEDLLAALEGGDVDPGALEFYLSRETLDSVLEGAGADDEDGLEETVGHPVRAAEGMPDDTILLLDPDAVTDGEIADPTGIACGTIGKAT